MIRSNELKTIDSCAFSSLNKLKELKFYNNNLTSLNPELRHFDLRIMEYIDKINRINLSNNPIENKKEILDQYNEEKFSFY